MPALTDKDKITSAVEELIKPLVEAQGLELVEVEFSRPRRGRANLRIFLDREGGITLEEIARVSRVVGNLLDVHDFIEPSYNLEVSSPCLTRELKKPKDFQRYKGRLVRLTTRGAIGGRRVHRGILQGLENEEIVCLEEEGQLRRIPLAEVAKARLDIEL